MIRNFTDLEVWQISSEIVVKTYWLLNSFPKEEKFGIVSQCKDSVISIAANIAEGFLEDFISKTRSNFITTREVHSRKQKATYISATNLAI